MSAPSLRASLAPLLPAGLTPDDFPNLRESDEFRGGRGAVSDDETQALLTPREDLPTQDDYDALIKAQVAAKSAYVDKISALLATVEKRGPAARAAALAKFRALARAELESSFVRGVGATAEGDARDKRFRKWLGARVDFETSRFDEFLGRVLEDTEAMPREQRADLYGRTLDHAFNRGAFAVYDDQVRISWMLSPAEHCEDCLERAAQGPYLPPGRGDGDPGGLPELPSFPRDGATECLGNCKCYLVVERREEGDEEPVYEAGDRVVDPGVRIEDGDEKATADYSDEDLAAIQAEADGYVAQAQYARAMHDLQVDGGPDLDWIETRTEANSDLIDLQERTGLRFVPRTGADAVSLVARELPPQGYEPVGPADRGRVVEGMDAAAADGTDFTFGVVSKYDARTGAGVYVDQTGEEIPFNLSSPRNRIVLGTRRGKRPASPRPWQAPAPFAGGTNVVAPEGYSFAVEDPTDEGAALTVASFRTAYERRPVPALHGVQVRVTDRVEAPVVRGSVVLAPPGMSPADASVALAAVAVPVLLGLAPPPAGTKVTDSVTPAWFRSPVSPRAVPPALRPALDDYLYWYSRWLFAPDDVPEDVTDFYEGFEDFDDADYPAPEYPDLDDEGIFAESDEVYYGDE
jgi:hypothetical protein